MGQGKYLKLDDDPGSPRVTFPSLSRETKEQVENVFHMTQPNAGQSEKTNDTSFCIVCLKNKKVSSFI